VAIAIAQPTGQQLQGPYCGLANILEYEPSIHQHVRPGAIQRDIIERLRHGLELIFVGLLSP
jgi:hypothetical protein